MDPFEVRMQFITLLKRLTASQQSVQKVVSFSVKFTQCSEDLWDCILEECKKGSINTRINILHFLDSLCETCHLLKSRSASPGNGSAQKYLYVDYLARDLPTIIELVVPEGRQGLPNLSSTKQILESWRTKRVIDPQKIEDVLSTLNSRTNTTAADPSQLTSEPATEDHIPRNDVFKRIEEDRERHKRLRERRWVQPTSHNTSDYRALSLALFLPMTSSRDSEGELPIDIEFENDWETTSDWNEDDDEAAAEEVELCFQTGGEAPMDLS